MSSKKTKHEASRPKTPRSPKTAFKAPTKAQARRIIEEGAKKITEDDIRKVHERSDEIKRQFSSEGPLSKYIEEAKVLISVVSDYWNGSYRAIPYYSLAAIVVTLLYVLTPIDLIPDFIPVIGFIDDMTVFGVCLLFVTQDLQAYKEWKQSQPSKRKKSA